MEIDKIEILNLPVIKGLVDRINDLEVNAEIIAPTKIAVIKDKPLYLHYDNVLMGADATKSHMCEALGELAWGRKYFAKFLATTTGTKSGTIVIQTKGFLSPKTKFAEGSIKKAFSFVSLPNNQGEGQTKRVLFIGDSITANGIYAREIKTLFSEDGMKVNLLGTMGYGGIYNGLDGNVYNSDGQIRVPNFTFNANGEVLNANGEIVKDSSGDNMTFYHEGHGGWTAEDFCTLPNKSTGYVNAFYNPSSQAFDFSYYMSRTGFNGVDYVFINLGINDIAKYDTPTEENINTILGYYQQMIDSIHAYDTNVKIFIGLCILPAEYEYCEPSFKGQRQKTTRLYFHKALLSKYENKETDGFVVVPLGFVVDTLRDFPTEQRAISERDSTMIDFCTDIVHPKRQGYLKMADVIFAYIKYGTYLWND